jgi:tetratricopeptide (TPR) repeat protein
MAEVIGGHYQFDRATDEIGVVGMRSVLWAVDTQTGDVVHLIAMHEGRLSDAGALLDEMVRLFPDPNFSTQLIYAVLGEDLGSGAVIYSAFANLFVGQYQRVLDDTQTLFQLIPEINRSMLENIGQNSPGDVYLVDLVLARGIAMCATDDLEASLAVFELAANLDPDYALIYVLAGDAAFRAGYPDEALEALDYARGFSDELDSFIDAAIENEDINCASFFDNFIDGWEAQ